MRKIYLLGIIFLTACSSTPTWTHATYKQRQMGIYIPDDNYYNSPQYQEDIDEDVKVILDWKEKYRIK